MASESTAFRFRKGVLIGALAAEEDEKFLQECFVDTGLLESLVDLDDHRRIVLGRTGSGKSALFLRLAETQRVISICPDELSVGHLSNSELLKELHDSGISLMPLYKLLWKHVFVVEILRTQHSQLSESETAPGFFRNLVNSLSKNPKAQARKDALQYLSDFGDSFWQTTEFRLKEVTDRIEAKIKASIGAELGSTATLGVGGSQDSSSERKATVEKIGREFVQAIQVKKLSEVVKWLGEETQGLPSLFIVIDGLDEDWADSHLRYDLIRALIETAREFRAIHNTKILIALREDLFNTVLEQAAAAGGQREKHRQLAYELIWRRDQLKAIVETRVNKLIRVKYTKAKVKIDDLIDQVEGKPGVQYMIDRTLSRPRDIIAFFNQCIDQASENPKITRKMILDAEPKYSRDRLTAVIDEWRTVEPCLEEIAGLLTGSKVTLMVRELSDAVITECCNNLYLKYWDSERTSPTVQLARKHCEWPESVPAAFVREHFVRTLFRVGILLIKAHAEDKYVDSIQDSALVSSLEITGECKIRIHAAFWKALRIKQQQ